MKNKKGKYLKQSRIYKGVYGVIAVLAMLIVFSIIAFVFYRAGERSATTIQETEPHTTSEPQEIYREQIETVVHETDPIIVEPTVTERKETVPATEETTQPTESVPQIVETAEDTGRTATVLRSAGELNVRSGAGTSYNEIGRLKGGDTITVYEQINAKGLNWKTPAYIWEGLAWLQKQTH